MKTSAKAKLTLTVRKSVILKARKYSDKTGKSISSLFEEIFEQENIHELKSEPERAADRLLRHLDKSKPVVTKDDRKLLRKYVKGKFA
jgi:hypothetical protein